METVSNIVATPNTAILWQNERLYLLDQRLLPQREVYVVLTSIEDVAAAICDMVVRGAPAIGITAAYGVALGAKSRFAKNPNTWPMDLAADIASLARARPTAVNLFWALNKMQNLLAQLPTSTDPFPKLVAAARSMHHEDAEANRQMGLLGAALITSPTSVITHCNAGALATGGYGTALGVIRAAYSAGKLTRVYADETRPWLQGARLTTWELQRDGIPVTLLVDSAASACMARGDIGWVIVGADRIAANGDVANKIGTYQLAISARYHGVKVMVVAPVSTIDMTTRSGNDIPIEERYPQELLGFADHVVAPAATTTWNPVFDVTKASLVDALVTECGVVLAPNADKIARMLA